MRREEDIAVGFYRCLILVVFVCYRRHVSVPHCNRVFVLVWSSGARGVYVEGSIKCQDRVVDRLLSFPNSFVMVGGPVDGYEGPCPAVVVRGEVCERAANAPRIGRPGKVRIYHVRRSGSAFFVGRASAFFVQEVDSNGRGVVLIVPTYVFFLGPRPGLALF